MGNDPAGRSFSPEDRQRFRDKVQRCLDALARMLAERSFSPEREHIGLEIELNLIDAQGVPAMANAEVLRKIDDPSFQTELGQHNIEINVRPHPLRGDEALLLEDELRASLDGAEVRAKTVGTGLVMIGILPTLRGEHFDPHWLSENDRYAVLNHEIFSSRGEEILLNIEGVSLPGHEQERLHSYADSILPESACTSVQLHLQVTPEDFADHWNAAQCLAGVQVATAANSPFLLDRALWHETRVPLFQQATDTRPQELKNQGVRPRVWFGERWVTSIFDLFEENARYFPALMPEADDEDPLEALRAGRAPRLSELRLHNGTVWRWNRPVYDVVDGQPHLRVENRVLPAGPTVIDTMANAAFFYGAQRALADQERPLWSQMSFHAAEENLYSGARHGMDAQLYWPGQGWTPPHELVLRTLLPMAHDGLARCGVSDAARERYLSVIEQRCLTRQTGASWQRSRVTAFEERGADRQSALRAMLGEYVELMHHGDPVHTWPTG
ncbi:gamma-glutamyl:cysteine ligase YbdK (ATP-grasp superfamily) [Actinoalloteichus hoggarensis]|uniref:Carboxylate-amine ligase YbdK n=1 Tax=Actinoalloteichus hoggarensis TaxID=1470176 RepID=A0A221WC22_9PSEU|nr:glutamate--cysteine ligase [Actinoalloteichus hoggarensis]ASO22827.1 Carboxylate-amine ligase YbdK [Actinoalloteichus hoggarensis]MBB5924031.1 gamma-glutamyl:cysteine ligase YbdK (ATP-grasp superfamily) [Actinoalloteichus hoggarensis]